VRRNLCQPGLRSILAAALFLPLLLAACEGKGKKRVPQNGEGKLTVQGVLTRIAAIGGETTGWAIRLDKPKVIQGSEIQLLEVNSRPERWQPYEGKRVEATGVIVFRQGVERGRWPVLEVEFLREIPPPDS
jgi:hypothetical protein